MRSMNVICARINDKDDRIEVVREITNDDGSVEYNCLSMPVDKLESISAIYEMDDLDEIVECAIYESLMPVDDIHPDAQAARLQKRTRLANVKSSLGPMRPANGRINQKTRLQEAGIPVAFVDAVDDDPIEVIKQHSRMDPDSLNAKRVYMQAVRRGEPDSLNPTPNMNKDSTRTRLPQKESVVNDVVSNVRKLPTISMRHGKRVT